MLTNLRDNDLQHGYFVARRLGYILKAQNEFSPSQTEQKYQGKHGLTDAFFIDTVKNAIKWHSRNKDETATNKEQKGNAANRTP